MWYTIQIQNIQRYDYEKILTLIIPLVMILTMLSACGEPEFDFDIDIGIDIFETEAETEEPAETEVTEETAQSAE